MGNSKDFKPTASELEILKVLWKQGPSTVRDVNNILNTQAESEKTIGYTTTLKIMQIMFEKGMLTRTEKGRSHEYTHVVAEEKTKSALLDNFLETAFGGSHVKLVMQALGNRKASREDIHEIRQFLDKIEKGQD